jgi:hypothetical protein
MRTSLTPQADVGLQPGGSVVPGSRGELPACRQFLAPPGKKLLDLPGRRRDPQLRVHRHPRPVHLVQRAFHDPARQVMQFNLVPQLQELEEHRYRSRGLKGRVSTGRLR